MRMRWLHRLCMLTNSLAIVVRPATHTFFILFIFNNMIHQTKIMAVGGNIKNGIENKEWMKKIDSTMRSQFCVWSPNNIKYLYAV